MASVPQIVLCVPQKGHPHHSCCITLTFTYQETTPRLCTKKTTPRLCTNKPRHIYVPKNYATFKYPKTHATFKYQENHATFMYQKTTPRLCTKKPRRSLQVCFCWFLVAAREAYITCHGSWHHFILACIRALEHTKRTFNAPLLNSDAHDRELL